MDNKDVFSRNLNYQMNLHNRSRQDISDALGVSYFTVTSWVNGTKYPRMNKVDQLAKYFGISISDLVEDKTTEEKEKPTVIDDGLSDDLRELIKHLKTLPEDKIQMLIQVAKSIK